MNFNIFEVGTETSKNRERVEQTPLVAEFFQITNNFSVYKLPVISARGEIIRTNRGRKRSS